MHLRPEPANCSSLVMRPLIWLGLQGLISNFVETYNFQALLVMKSARKNQVFVVIYWLVATIYVLD